MSLDLVPIWTVILAISVFMYVLLDGFDLGLGVLFPFAPDDAARGTMMASIAGVVLPVSMVFGTTIPMTKPMA